MRKILMVMLGIFLLMTRVEAAGTGELIIFHTNDSHCRMLPTDDEGKSIGLAEMTGAVKATKKLNKWTLWLDAGDTFHGMPRVNISKGQNMVKLLNDAGIDMLVPGNHDFNYGWEQLMKLSARAKFPVIAANVYREGKRILPANKILKMDGLKVGVIGLCTPETMTATNPKNVEGLEFRNPVEEAREQIAELRPKVDVLIAVMHMGLDERSEYTSERIARETEGLDVIVDGHSHTELPEGLQVGKTLIVQAGCYEHNLGRVKLLIRDGRITASQAQLLKGQEVARLGAADKKIARSIAKIEKQTQKYFSEVVATTAAGMTSERHKVRREESELGDLVTDALKWKTKSDIAIINGGALRADLPAGKVTRGDILEIIPFGNRVESAEVSGQVVKEMLEQSVYGYPSEFGGFLNVSGLTFEFDATRERGDRVSNVYVNGEVLDYGKVYKLAALDFQFAGGDGYTMLKCAQVMEDYGTIDEIVEEYLNKVGTTVKFGRIKNLHELEESKEAA